MMERVYNLAFGLAVAFLLPAICFLLGLIWTKLIGGWPDAKFRRWWITFCLALPFVFLGMMIKRMAEDNFQALEELWSAKPVVLLSMIAAAAIMMRLACSPLVKGSLSIE